MLLDILKQVRVTLTRRDWWPADSPTHLIIGFRVSHPALGEDVYCETSIPRAEVAGLDREALKARAWREVREGLRRDLVRKLAAAKDRPDPIAGDDLGREWTPPED